MKIANVNVIVVKDIIMIKLKTLLVEQEQENKYPADAPEHFGGGENIDIFGYQGRGLPFPYRPRAFPDHTL